MSDEPREPAEATVKTPNRFALVWLVPIVAACLAVYLGWQTLSSRGPLVTIVFDNGMGLSAGETKVEHNAVAIGTVESVRLSANFQQVIAKVRIAKSAAGLLTSHARFWVVRARFSLTDVSGLQTLVSGSYIAVDPGKPGGTPARHFRGLDQPPGERSDEPGRIFTLQASQLDWLQNGAPVFYRGIAVGQMVNYQDTGMNKPIIIHVFIKAPYDGYVRSATHFWNTTGLMANFGPTGLHVAVQSVQALLAGGIDFANFEDAAASPAASSDTVFPLYNDFDAAQNAGFHDNIRYVTYFYQSVAGLQVGSAVQLYGIRVGTVTATQLEVDPKTGQPRVRVAFDVQPGRIFTQSDIPKVNSLQETRKLVALGMRATVDTSNLLTGQDVIGLDIIPNAQPAVVTTEGDLIVWPSQTGGLQDLTNSLGEFLSKLNKIPVDELGANANALLASLRSLAATADTDLKPVATQVPELSQQLQTTLKQADRLLQSLREGYGPNSETMQNLQELTSQAIQAVQSIRQLTNYLDRHPGSVLWGR